MSDPTPEPLQHAQDDSCSDEAGNTGVRNIYVRRIGEALNDDGEIVPLAAEPAAARSRPTKRKDR